MVTMVRSTLKERLKTHFGYDSFRPYQEDIIQAVLDKKDVFAVLPTGGGKSLCFQLPALVNAGLTLVVSPLIALMKDQVDSLKANGIPSTFINSSISAHEMNQRMTALHKNKYRILYIAPERLTSHGFVESMKNVSVQLIAIDEAHCISEWGHDFRPEYRQLARLKADFLGTPIIALTATATERVRQDIVNQLQLRDPKLVVASFNRPNLTYRVIPKQNGVGQLLAFLKDRPGENGIVYCLARKTCESIASKLQAEGIPARPYHAGLNPDVRNQNQNLFLRDEVRVICATIAFGMGIHKSNVRYVAHYNLPRNMESYYQETGRAGRDGLPSECLLLFSAGDANRLSRFIGEKSDENERILSHQQLGEMLAYAENGECRRKVMLNYFGEQWEQVPCGGCDNCLEPRDYFDATLPAQKILSCVFRIKEKSGFSVGLHHTVDVLMGKSTEKVQKWDHQALSTFGIGSDFKKGQWVAMGQELMRKGYMQQSPNGFKTLELTEKGWDALKNKSVIELTKPLSSLRPKRSKNVASDYNQTLFDSLRSLRKSIADDRNVPSYIIFSDASLREMAQACPVTLEDFRQIGGVGTKKLNEFGPVFIKKIKSYLSSSGEPKHKG